MLNKMRNLLKEEQGQGMTEYGLVLAGVVTVVVAAVILLRTQLTSLLGSVNTAIQNAVSDVTTP